VSNIDSEEEQESPDAKKQSPKKKAKPQVNGKKDPNEEDSAEEGQTPRKQPDNYCIFNHSSEENIYHVKQWIKLEVQNQLGHMKEARDHVSEFSNDIGQGISLDQTSS